MNYYYIILPLRKLITNAFNLQFLINAFFMKIILLIFLTLTLLVFSPAEKVSAQTAHTPSTGMYGLTELTLGYGLQGDVQANQIGFTGISALAGYWINPKLSAGLGTGFLGYNGSGVVPLFLEGGYYFDEFGLGKMRFFLKADAGILIGVTGDIPAIRVFGNPCVGLQLPVSRTKELSVSLGFFTQMDQINQGNIQSNQLSNFINGKIGLRFY